MKHISGRFRGRDRARGGGGIAGLRYRDHMETHTSSPRVCTGGTAPADGMQEAWYQGGVLGSPALVLEAVSPKAWRR